MNADKAKYLKKHNESEVFMKLLSDLTQEEKKKLLAMWKERKANEPKN